MWLHRSRFGSESKKKNQTRNKVGQGKHNNACGKRLVLDLYFQKSTRTFCYSCSRIKRVDYKKLAVMTTGLKIVVVIQYSLFTLNSFSQHSSPDSVEAFFISKPINFDGNPDEAVWQSARHISNFTQRELQFGESASEKTEVAILYDVNNLHIGVWCYQQRPEKI